MKLSVVILNYNVRYFLELCIKSVQAALKDIDSEIIVVDNNSEDDSCNMVRELFSEVILIENRENYGFSKGNNIGVKKAQGEYVCILNPDTVVGEDTFEVLLKFAESKEDLGIVGCRLINGKGGFLPESKRNIPYVQAAFKKLLGDSKAYYAHNVPKESISKVDILVGAFMLLRKNVYNELGGFDEDYFMYGEDIDISYKSLQQGYHNYYYGGITVIHFKGESTLRDKNYAKRFYGAMQIFYKKHFRKNILYDLIVWLGVQIVYTFRTKPELKKKRVQQYAFISNKQNELLNKILGKNIFLMQKLKYFSVPTEVIFDANFMSYKEIICNIEKQNNIANTTYKILPNNSKFILGSDSTIDRGEVFVFDE
ncbi:glycosyltransferase family 2 protein [Tamlana fucoidanivorans]|uniref:Glycosyltransferase family 2 protein n=1 Tax=Allotamlana fucoidanivorans TaxID=2583814 RepID=A0A5C4SNQ3_9FLAO|nr:glycosyltransferase family 2 protein [Tamlana fucoidanivorans]TNJ45805.1 glycosyltransferase family 2 protein [Tamlana fucoidanivorans]